ncbi:MAG: ABC transporter permease subunit [Oscillospiraceae bacterium]
MTIYIKELKHSAKAFWIWTCAIAFMLLVCIFMFPQMKDQMDSMTDIFANMGSFTSAFGMDRLSFGELMGFYGVECGNMLGIGGGFFAALLGVGALANEERDHTAEFLLSHPVSRASVVTQKLLSVITQVLAMNIIIAAVSLAGAAIIGEEFAMKEFLLLHTAYTAMEIEIACVCFGASAFLRKGGAGVGLGLSLAFYFLNIVRNITDKAEFLKYITPYAYSDASGIISEAKLETELLIIGAAVTAAAVFAAYFKYTRKDIAS